MAKKKKMKKAAMKKSAKKSAKRSAKKKSPKKSPAKKKSAARKPPKKSMARLGASRKNAATRNKPGLRELIDTGTDKRFVRRDEQGQFFESDDVGRSLAADIRQPATTDAGPGMGDRGD
jgi:hypothetical protein